MEFEDLEETSNGGNELRTQGNKRHAKWCTHGEFDEELHLKRTKSNHSRPMKRCITIYDHDRAPFG